MAGSRREFLAQGALSVFGIAVAGGAEEHTAEAEEVDAPKAASGIAAVTFAEAEKLVQVSLSEAERAQAARSWPHAMSEMYARRVGAKKIALENSLAPGSVWNPAVKGVHIEDSASAFVRSDTGEAPLPEREEEIAFAPVVLLSQWIAAKKLTSVRLTEIYLRRLEKYDAQLKCVITLTREHALEQARRADAEIAAGQYRGPLHGIPWGAKDLLDTKGIATTYGAEPFRDRVPVEDAAVTKRLNDAGAVLVAKLSLGALAMNDVWFGGQTKNPWLLKEGASGSSAGPGAAVAAGLVAFAIGSETQGSIVSPSMRCGVTGLRPTFGRVPRTGAMTLCWSLDKLGPMARSVEDTLLVLNAISGPDDEDVACVGSSLRFNANAHVAGLRVGYFPAWLKEKHATSIDSAAVDAAKKLGMELVALELPDWPYDSLSVILDAESAAAFEEITLDHRVDALKMQSDDAWPNAFRLSRFLSAVDFVQADRLRRKVAGMMAEMMRRVDLLLVPSLRGEMLQITNFTGHPSLTLRAGFVEIDKLRSDWEPEVGMQRGVKLDAPHRVPYGVTLIGRLFDEGTIGEVGVRLEKMFDVMKEKPAGFY